MTDLCPQFHRAQRRQGLIRSVSIVPRKNRYSYVRLQSNTVAGKNIFQGIILILILLQRLSDIVEAINRWKQRQQLASRITIRLKELASRSALRIPLPRSGSRIINIPNSLSLMRSRIVPPCISTPRSIAQRFHQVVLHFSSLTPSPASTIIETILASSLGANFRTFLSLFACLFISTFGVIR